MEHKGHLFVIEGVDGSGKATQTEKLYQYLVAKQYPVRKVTFPDYSSPSSSLVKMYLNGEFGSEPDAVNAFTTSLFFAVDRFASFRKNWQEAYLQGEIILADRYTTSNMIHQGSKINNQEEKEIYLNWLTDLEYRLMELPEPTCVFFLDMPPEYSLKLRQARNELKQDLTQDIHENNQQYLLEAYYHALDIAKQQKWQIISCVCNGQIRTIEDIHQEITKYISTYLT